MATLRKRNGKWHVEVRRKGHRNVYQTFVQKSDARGFILFLNPYLVHN